MATTTPSANRPGNEPSTYANAYANPADDPDMPSGTNGSGTVPATTGERGTAITTVHYRGPLPVTDETMRGWVAQGVTGVRFTFTTTLGELIWFDGMEAVNDLVDNLTGVSMTDLNYGIDYPATARKAADGNNSIVLWVEGAITDDPDYMEALDGDRQRELAATAPPPLPQHTGNNHD